MENKTPTKNNDLQAVLNRIDALEGRITKIEQFIGKRYFTSDRMLDPDQASTETSAKEKQESSHGIESRFGEQVFAWISSIIVLFLVIFLLSFFQNKSKEGLGFVVAFVSTGLVLLLTQVLKKSFPRQVFLLRITVQILFYYLISRLHFFADNPIIASEAIGLLILILPIAYMGYFALKQKSEILTGLSILMLICMSIFASHTWVSLSLLNLVAVIGLFLFIRNSWSRLLLFSVVMVYISHLLWFMNNPIMGQPFQPVASHQMNLVYLFLNGFIFSMIAMGYRKKNFTDSIVISVTIWNALLFSLILMWEVSVFFKESYQGIFTAIAVFSLIYSIILQIKKRRVFITAFYAVVSFVSISILVYGYTGLPDAYLWLALQSLLVVSIALWYRSPLIVIANTILYGGLLIFYLIQSEPITSINIAFTLVAGFSARILNWKKERLTLKTEAMRSTYLFATFFMILFTLYHLIPDKFITLSWLGAAGLFFSLSLVLKNIKYRWMALATLIITVVYLFFVDLKNMDTGFRVIAFMLIAVITLAASFYYTKRVKKKSETVE